LQLERWYGLALLMHLLLLPTDLQGSCRRSIVGGR
jgi:hypothetical protein